MVIAFVSLTFPPILCIMGSETSLQGAQSYFARRAILVFPLTMQTALLYITSHLPFSCHLR